MRIIATIAAAIAISASATAQTPDEVESWDVLANGKEYIVAGPGIWDADNSAYIFAEKDYQTRISLDQDAEKLTVAKVRETPVEVQQDGQTQTVTQISRIVSVLEVETNGAFLDYLGTNSGHHDMEFKSLEIVKYGDGIGLHDYNKNRMWSLVLPAVEVDNN